MLQVENFIKGFVSFDILYLIISIYTVIIDSKKGFISSILLSANFLFSFIFAFLIFGKINFIFSGLSNTKLFFDSFLFFLIFICNYFLIKLFVKIIDGTLKLLFIKIFSNFLGFLFGIIRGYLIAICLVTTFNIFYNSNNLPINSDKSYIYVWVEKGSNYLIKEFPIIFYDKTNIK